MKFTINVDATELDEQGEQVGPVEDAVTIRVMQEWFGRTRSVSPHDRITIRVVDTKTGKTIEGRVTSVEAHHIEHP